MMIKKLRKQKNWSQEQLSQLSGLSLRTIQRIESGNKASSDSLNALASVFETDVENLEQEIIVLDKDSAQWKKAPLWVRIIFVGSNTIRFRRRDAVIFEIMLMTIGLVFMLAAFLTPDTGKQEVLTFCSFGMILSAYYMSIKIRMGDRYLVW